MIKPYWVEFVDRNSACVEAEDIEEARQLAIDMTGATVQAIHLLRYPAHPRLNHRSGCPTFCHQPDVCKGSGTCRARFMCDH